MPDNEDILSDTQEQEFQQSERLLTCSFNCSEQEVQNCRKCNRSYCVLHTSRFSPNFCQDCFRNLSIIEDKFSRTFEYIDNKNQQLHIRRESCAKWYIDGPDWPFLNVWIDNLSDDELRILWNFHYFVMKTIEAENETRKIEKYRKLREQPSTRLITGSVTKGTRKVAVTKVPDTPETIRMRLKKQGIADTIIDQMIKAMGI